MSDPAPSPRAAGRTAWVAEITDARDPSRPAARFATHWEDDATGDHAEGPADASLDDALGWAREHAAVVFLHLAGGGGMFSAGDEHPDGEVPQWTGGPVAARPPGTPLDGSVQRTAIPLRTDVRAELDAERLTDLRDRLSAASGVAGVRIERVAERHVVVRFTISAGGIAEALTAAQPVIERAAQVDEGVRTAYAPD